MAGVGSRVGILVLLAAGCGSGSHPPPDQSSAGSTAAAAGRDPCTLVSGEEMAQFIGPLAEPPYRVSTERQPDPGGERCLYRARDRRNVTIQVDWEEGEQYLRMFGGVVGTVQNQLAIGEAARAPITGNWDGVVFSLGQLIAYKGPVGVHVDPYASRLTVDQSARIASLALTRPGQPLAYDGSRAARERPAPPADPSPCSLVTRGEVEALMGLLARDPYPSDDEAGCEFELAGGQLHRRLTVYWRDGFYGLGQQRYTSGMAQAVMQANLDPETRDLADSAAGPAEPWDDKLVIMGGLIAVVRRDVYLQITADGVDGFDQERALALLRLAARRVP